MAKFSIKSDIVKIAAKIVTNVEKLKKEISTQFLEKATATIC